MRHLVGAFELSLRHLDFFWPVSSTEALRYVRSPLQAWFFLTFSLRIRTGPISWPYLPLGLRQIGIPF